MLVHKKYKMLMSVKLGNGTIVSLEFETGLDEDGADETELFAKCKQSVKNDIKKAAKDDPLVRVVWAAVVNGVKLEERVNDNLD